MTLFKKASLLASLLALTFCIPFSAAAAEEKEKKDDGDDTALLQAVGGLSAAFVYQTQQSIGMLHDAKEKELYTEKQCEQMLQITINLIGVVDKQLTALGKTDLEEADKKSVAQFHTINKLLQRQGEALKSYWEADEDEHKEKYLDYRKKSEAKINEALGIKAPAEKKDKDDDKDEKEEKDE